MIKKPAVYDGARDRGLEGVEVCSTDLSRIHESQLYFRGWRFEDLAENSSFPETAYLLLKGRLPNATELRQWESALAEQLFLDKSLPLDSLPTDSVHPMAWLRTAVSLIGQKEERGIGFHQNASATETAGLCLIAKMPLLISFLHRKRQGLDPIEPVTSQSPAWNFLYTLKGQAPSPFEEKALSACLILHADHGLNCSTFTARVTASSLSDVYSAVVSAIGSLKGPLHGGANEKVMAMLNKLSSVKEAESFVDKALQNKEKIMGFGHRVYKTQDPRAVFLKSLSEKITKERGRAKLFEISRAMEQRVKEKKGLCANVDFYSASVYHCLGIPDDLFTPVFVMSRTPGWLAHINEQYAGNRIYRPASRWTGPKETKKWIPLQDRA